MNITKDAAIEILDSDKKLSIELITGQRGFCSKGNQVAWFYMHHGMIDAFTKLGLLTEEEHDELETEWDTHYPEA